MCVFYTVNCVLGQYLIGNNMALDVFTNVFNNIESTINSVIVGKTANMIAIISPVLLAAFVVYVIFVTWSYFGASIEQSMFDLLKRILAWGVIISFALNLGTYNNTVVPMVLGLGEGLAAAFSGAPANATALDSLVNLLSDMLKANNDVYASLPMTEVGAKIRIIVTNFVVLICFALFLIIAAAYIILAKVFLAILVVLGPIFIALALFPATRQFFSSWLNQVINYNLYFLLINVVGAIFITYINDTFDPTTLLTDGGVLHLVLVLLFFAIILLKLPELSSGLAGGIAANGFGALAGVASQTSRLAKLGGKGGGGGESKPTKCNLFATC